MRQREGVNDQMEEHIHVNGVQGTKRFRFSFIIEAENIGKLGVVHRSPTPLNCDVIDALHEGVGGNNMFVVIAVSATSNMCQLRSERGERKVPTEAFSVGQRPSPFQPPCQL